MTSAVRRPPGAGESVDVRCRKDADAEGRNVRAVDVVQLLCLLGRGLQGEGIHVGGRRHVGRAASRCSPPGRRISSRQAQSWARRPCRITSPPGDPIFVSRRRCAVGMRQAVAHSALYYGRRHIVLRHASEGQHGLGGGRLGRRAAFDHLVDAVVRLPIFLAAVLLMVAQVRAAAANVAICGRSAAGLRPAVSAMIAGPRC